MIKAQNNQEPVGDSIDRLNCADITFISKRLKSDREESFCLIKAVNDVSDAKAYRDAGYSPNGAGQNAGRMIKKDYIIGRIAYLRAENAIKAGITRETQAIKLERAQQLALKEGDTTTFVRAVVEESKHYGLSIDKQQIDQTLAQQARTAVEDAQSKEFAEFMVMKGLRQQRESEDVPEGLKVVNEVVL